MEAKRKIRVNKGKLTSRIIAMLLVVVTVNICVSFAKYPEQYLTTWRCQLRRDLVRGNQKAIEYYNDRYIANGKQLFGDKFIVEDVVN